jgi:hypothetical protein
VGHHGARRPGIGGYEPGLMMLSIQVLMPLKTPR